MKKGKCRILMIAPAKEVKGGMTAVVSTLMDGIEQSTEYTVDFFPAYKDKFNSIGKILYSIGRLFLFLFAVQKYDLFHLHSAAYGSFYRKSIYVWICRAFQKKVVFHMHGSRFEKFHNSSNFNRLIIKKTLDRVDAVIVLSQQMEALARDYCGNERIYILKNPIAMPELHEIPKRSLPEDRKVQLLFMGEIGKRKGVYDIVDTVRCMPPEMQSRVVFNVCGNNEVDKLRALVKEGKIEESFRISDWVQGEEKKQLLINSDIYILPSYHEGLPVSILEAMSCLLPVISTDAGGIPEIVKDGYNGIIVKPGDIEAIKDAVIKLVSDEETRVCFGKNGRQLVEEYEVKNVIKELSDIYVKTMGMGG